MRAIRIAILGCLLTMPALALAETAEKEAEAHDEAAEHGEGTGHDEDAGHATEEAHGATDHESGHDAHGDLTFGSLLSSREFQGTLVNFAALILLIGWVIRKKGNPALAARREQVETELAEAQRLRAEAERRHMETATRLEKLDEEMAQIRADMIKAGEVERDRIVAQAEEKAARMRKDTTFLIEQQVKQLREDLTREASSAAVDAAQTLLQRSTTPADQNRLAESYLERLDEVLQERRS